MAKKKSAFKLGKRAQKIVKKDLIHSLAIASVVLNILFLVGWAVITNGSSDQEFFETARTRLCVDNYQDNLNRVISDAENEDAAKLAALELSIQCVDEDFQPFYENAISSYTQNITSQEQ